MCRLSSPPGAEHPCFELEMMRRPFPPSPDTSFAPAEGTLG